MPPSVSPTTARPPAATTETFRVPRLLSVAATLRRQLDLVITSRDFVDRVAAVYDQLRVSDPPTACAFLDDVTGAVAACRAAGRRAAPPPTPARAAAPALRIDWARWTKADLQAVFGQFVPDAQTLAIVDQLLSIGDDSRRRADLARTLYGANTPGAAARLARRLTAYAAVFEKVFAVPDARWRIAPAAREKIVVLDAEIAARPA